MEDQENLIYVDEHDCLFVSCLNNIIDGTWWHFTCVAPFSLGFAVARTNWMQGDAMEQVEFMEQVMDDAMEGILSHLPTVQLQYSW